MKKAMNVAEFFGTGKATRLSEVLPIVESRISSATWEELDFLIAGLFPHTENPHPDARGYAYMILGILMLEDLHRMEAKQEQENRRTIH